MGIDVLIFILNNAYILHFVANPTLPSGVEPLGLEGIDS